jgi:hypothetical protein
VEEKSDPSLGPLLALGGAALAAAGAPSVVARLAARTGRGEAAIALLKKGGALPNDAPGVLTASTLDKIYRQKLPSQANMMLGIPDINPVAAKHLTKHLQSKLTRAQNMAKQQVPYNEIGKETGWYMIPVKGLDARTGKTITRTEWMYNLPTKHGDFDADGMLKAITSMGTDTASRTITADTVMSSERGVGKLLTTMGYDLKRSKIVFETKGGEGEASFAKAYGASPEGGGDSFVLTINAKLFNRAHNPYTGDAAKTKLAEIMDHEFTHAWDKIVGNPETGSSVVSARAQMEAAGEIKPFGLEHMSPPRRKVALDLGQKVLKELRRVAIKKKRPELARVFENSSPGELFADWQSMMDDLGPTGFHNDEELWSAMTAFDDVVREAAMAHVAETDPKVYARYSSDFGEVKAKAAELSGNAALTIKGAMERLTRLGGEPRLHTSPTAGEISASAERPRTIEIDGEEMSFPPGTSDDEILDTLTEKYGKETSVGAPGEKTLLGKVIRDKDTEELLIPAGHATPHTFKPVPGNQLGAFDINKMLTGEGAMAYGPGIYTATDEGVLGWYHANFTSDKVTFFNHLEDPWREYPIRMRDVPAGVTSEQMAKSKAHLGMIDMLNSSLIRANYHDRRASTLANEQFYTSFNKFLPVRNSDARNWDKINQVIEQVGKYGYAELKSLSDILDHSRFKLNVTMDDIIKDIHAREPTPKTPSSNTAGEMFEHEINRDKYLKESYYNYLEDVKGALDTPVTIMRTKTPANLYETVMRVKENQILDLNEEDLTFVDRLKEAVKKMDNNKVTDAMTLALMDMDQALRYPVAVIHATEGYVEPTDMLKLLDLAGYKISKYRANAKDIAMNYVIHDPKVSRIWKKRGVMGLMTVATMTGAALTEPNKPEEGT